MKENIIVGIIAVLVITGAIFTAMIIEDEEKLQKQQEKIIASEEVTDKCTEEYEISMINEDTTQVNSSEEKLSANSAMILKKHYKECNHTINEYAEILPELVNLSQEEIIKEFPEWELIGFSPNEIVLFREVEGACGEHFTLREEERKNSNLQIITKWSGRSI